MLRLPICELKFAVNAAQAPPNLVFLAFVLTHFASSLVQLMEISDIAVSHGAMAFSCFLERLDGVVPPSLLLSLV
jgi:hypothetical protein